MGTKKDVYMDWIVAADAIEIIAFVAILSKIQFSHQGLSLKALTLLAVCYFLRYGVDTFYGPDPSTKLETHLMNVQQTSMWNVFGGLIHKKKFHQTYVFFIEKLLFILSHAIVVKFLIRHKDSYRSTMRKKELPMRYLMALAFVITTAVWAYRDHANGNALLANIQWRDFFTKHMAAILQPLALLPQIYLLTIRDVADEEPDDSQGEAEKAKGASRVDVVTCLFFIARAGACGIRLARDLSAISFFERHPLEKAEVLSQIATIVFSCDFVRYLDRSVLSLLLPLASMVPLMLRTQPAPTAQLGAQLITVSMLGALLMGGMAFMHVANVVLLALMFRSGHFSTATESLLSWFGLKK